METVLTGVALASIITTNGLTINLTENFGSLASNGHVKQSATGNELVGDYGNAVTGMNCVVLVLSFIFLIVYIYGWFLRRHDRYEKLHLAYWIIILLAIIIGVVSAGITLNLTTNYASIQDLDTSPTPTIPGQNYKLRGVYGNATFGLAITSLITSSLAFIGMFVIIGLNWKQYTRKAMMHKFEYDFDTTSNKASWPPTKVERDE